MSRHQRPSSSNSTRSRIIVGSAMTAVFLSGGAGVAMAADGDDDGASSNSVKTTSVVGDLTGTVDNTVDDVTGLVDGLLGDDTKIEQTGNGNSANVINGNNNTINNNNTTNNHYGSKDDHKKDDHKGDKKHRDCGCPKDEKDDKKHEKDCKKNEAPVKHEEKKDDDDAVKGVTTVADIDDEVKGDSVDDEEVQGVSVEDYTPVGSADTGDGSFVPGVAPVASTWSTGDSMLAAGGALAAVGLLAGAGVGVGRHRRGGTHRVSA